MLVHSSPKAARLMLDHRLISGAAGLAQFAVLLEWCGTTQGPRRLVVHRLQASSYGPV